VKRTFSQKAEFERQYRFWTAFVQTMREHPRSTPHSKYGLLWYDQDDIRCAILGKEMLPFTPGEPLYPEAAIFAGVVLQETPSTPSYVTAKVKVKKED